MFKKPNFIQRVFIKSFFKHRKSLVDLALNHNHYLVIHLYLHKYYYSVPYVDVDGELLHLETHTSFKWCVVNNIIFVW